MKTIVITGGPCSGKTSAISILRERLAQAGVPAVFVAEAGTDLILAGTTPDTLGSMAAFQTQVAALQVEREANAKEQARCMEANPTTSPTNAEVLIICDRGICDGAAYVGPEEYLQVLHDNKLDANTVMDRYDAVFCLESTAKLATGAYTTANNTARSETPEEAAALDDRTSKAWEQHPHFYFIHNQDCFDKKANALFRALQSFLEQELIN